MNEKTRRYYVNRYWLAIGAILTLMIAVIIVIDNDIIKL